MTGTPFLEGRVGDKVAARTVDAKLGEVLEVFVAVPGTLGGKATVFGDSGARGRVSFGDAGCGVPSVSWQRVEPLMEHVNTPSPNRDVKVYANAVVFGPKHGTWIGFDKLEYSATPIDHQGPSLRTKTAQPSPHLGIVDRGWRNPLGVMRLSATVEWLGGVKKTAGISDIHDGQISPTVFRYTFRSGDDFAGWLTSFFNVPYLFGSAGQGVRGQAERYIGADCADVLVAALRRAGVKIDYSSVAEMVGKVPRVAGPVELAACDPDDIPEGGCVPTTLHWGRDLKAGDLLALDYIDSAELPRPWDHIVAVLEDRGPSGTPDGVLGPEDLVVDSGDGQGLKLENLGHQGHVRIAVLRPR